VRRTQLVTAATLVVIGLGTMGLLIPLYVADTGGSSNLSPAFMPYVAAALAIGGAASLLVGALRSRGGDGAAFTKGNWRFLGASVAVLVGSCGLMSLLGYLAGAPALVAGMLLLARVHPATVVAAAVVAPVALWLLFARLLATPLP
jgi:hypothetical protein